MGLVLDPAEFKINGIPTPNLFFPHNILNCRVQLLIYECKVQLLYMNMMMYYIMFTTLSIPQNHLYELNCKILITYLKRFKKIFNNYKYTYVQIQFTHDINHLFSNV